jgi:hypothetical protein
MEYAVYMESLPLDQQTQLVPVTLTGGVKRSNPEGVQHNTEALDWTKKVRIEEQSSYLF